jgi:arsenite oxidase large subunit
MRGTTLAKKREQLPNEPHEAVRIVIIDPRRTVTVNACEEAAGKANVLHLALESGTDLILFNALMTEIAAKGWLDRDFIAKSTTGFDEMLAANKVVVDEAARVTGLKADDIRKAATWIAEPKQGARRRTMSAYEKGLIWGNDNYRTNGALVNIALATGNVGRPGGGCVRMGGHQEGYVRPSDAFIGKPAPYVDQLLIGGKGGVHHIWDCDHFKTTLNAMEFRHVYKKRTDLVKYAMSDIPYGDRDRMVDAINGRDPAGRYLQRRYRHCADQNRPGCPSRPAGGYLGRDEPDLDERGEADAAHGSLYGSAGQCEAGLPGGCRTGPSARKIVAAGAQE